MDPTKKLMSRRVVVISVGLILLALGTGLYWFSTKSNQSGSGALSVWEEDCSSAYISPSFPNEGGICAVPINPIATPVSFNLTNQNGEAITLHDVSLGVVLTTGEAIRVTLSSNVPVNLHIYVDNRSGFDVRSLANEAANYGYLVVNSTGISAYNQSFVASASSLYIFELSVSQPKPIATAAFDVRLLP